MNLFRIKDLNFDITEAVLKGHLAEKLRWSISIKAKYPGGHFRGEQWEPRAYSENLPFVGGNVLERWTDILEQSPEWSDCYNENTGDQIASLYVFEHLDIYKSILEFGPLTNQDLFEVNWRARANVLFDDDYGENLELAIQTAVKFEGIEVPFREEEVSRTLLQKHIQEGDFTFDPGDGNCYKPIFRPR